MKNKLLAIMLVLTVVAGAFTGLCLATNAETGESPNLLEMYGYNPSFNDGMNPWTIDATGGILEQYDGDSQDDDGYCAIVTNRSTNFSAPKITGTQALSLFQEQGSGTYYYSFYVKCASVNTSCIYAPTLQLAWGGKYSAAGVEKGDVIASWIGTEEQYRVTVTDKEWVKVEFEFKLELKKDGKDLAQAIIYSTQRDFTTDHAPKLLFDNVTLIKKEGEWVNVTPEPEVAVPSQTRLDQVVGPDKTQIGAVNYHVWVETYDEWWNTDNTQALAMDRTSVQEMRSLSPAEFHFHLPFFAEINSAITSATYVYGDLSAGVAELPEYTEEIWEQEMDYAIDAGIDFMAYLWSEKGRLNASAYTYHINTKGLDGKIKMCAILQRASQDLNTLALAATEDYWYTIDGMPVVYIFGGESAITEEFVSTIRRKIAIAQYVKNGEVGKPAYIIGMGLNKYSAAVGVSSRGIDAAGWYAFSASGSATEEMKEEWNNKKTAVRRVSYKQLTDYAMNVMNDVSKIAKEGYAAISACATLGYDTYPRMVNPVSWMTPSGIYNLPYGGYTADLPTTAEVTDHVLDVLNLNKENRALFRTNTVLIYAWNEFNEGGWFCPTIKVDEKGNAIKNADGSNQVNREYLDAVKEAISLYRKNEGEAAIFDAEDNKIKDIELSTPEVPQITAPTTTEGATATQAPADNQGDGSESTTNNGWVLWAIIGGAVVVAAAAAVVVVIVLKKKKIAQNTK